MGKSSGMLLGGRFVLPSAVAVQYSRAELVRFARRLDAILDERDVIIGIGPRSHLNKVEVILRSDDPAQHELSAQPFRKAP